MGRNFDEYPGFQPKITHPKHFCPQCTWDKKLWTLLGLVFFYLNVVAIAGIGLRVVDLVVDGLKGGLEGFSIGLLSSINASSLSSSSTNSALKLK